ncbi:hypothetical protein RUM44_006450 [Polyplax serrata]|uniref:Uncharacterized protein n=1 Tax=Polyplax serrata TaxID=468196 RepID=A0ABR1AIV5_POLSC
MLPCDSFPRQPGPTRQDRKKRTKTPQPADNRTASLRHHKPNLPRSPSTRIDDTEDSLG